MLSSREVSRTEGVLQFRRRKLKAQPDSGNRPDLSEGGRPGIDEGRLFGAFALNGLLRIVRIRLPFPAVNCWPAAVFAAADI